MAGELEELREGIAKIVEMSNPSCGLVKECWAKCGECGADRILSHLAEQGVMIQTSHGMALLSDLLKVEGIGRKEH